jgi:hypothetical protein
VTRRISFLPKGEGRVTAREVAPGGGGSPKRRTPLRPRAAVCYRADAAGGPAQGRIQYVLYTLRAAGGRPWPGPRKLPAAPSLAYHRPGTGSSPLGTSAPRGPTAGAGFLGNLTVFFAAFTQPGPSGAAPFFESKAAGGRAGPRGAASMERRRGARPGGAAATSVLPGAAAGWPARAAARAQVQLPGNPAGPAGGPPPTGGYSLKQRGAPPRRGSALRPVHLFGVGHLSLKGVPTGRVRVRLPGNPRLPQGAIFGGYPRWWPPVMGGALRAVPPHPRRDLGRPRLRWAAARLAPGSPAVPVPGGRAWGPRGSMPSWCVSVMFKVNIWRKYPE